LLRNGGKRSICLPHVAVTYRITEMKTFIFAIVVIIITMALLVFLNWPTFMFMIPFIVVIAFVVWNGIEYSRQMDSFIEETNDEQEFDVVVKDGLTYVTPRSK
jgi:hypothetical protein